ncbi:MAG: DUF1599 domain-containing protein [Bacteroidales bacterium]
MELTIKQYNEVIEECRKLFLAKMGDYGTAWRVLRPSSLTDQIYIKANRIRSIQQKGAARVNEGIRPEFVGIINYSIMALIQLEKGWLDEPDTSENEAIVKLYDHCFLRARKLMEDKNHDYGEAWRNMRISSLTDIILMKLLRVKQIEDHQGKTNVSEGIDANYFDIVNYAVFALILLNSQENDSNVQH